MPARVWRAALAGQIDDDVSANLHRIGVPTLIAWGDRDEIARRPTQEAMAAAIPRSRFVVYHGSGHALHWDDAEGFVSELTAFVDGVAAQD